AGNTGGGGGDGLPPRVESAQAVRSPGRLGPFDVADVGVEAIEDAAPDGDAATNRTTQAVATRRRGGRLKRAGGGDWAPPSGAGAPPPRRYGPTPGPRIARPGQPRRPPAEGGRGRVWSSRGSGRRQPGGSGWRRIQAAIDSSRWPLAQPTSRKLPSRSIAWQAIATGDSVIDRRRPGR